MTVPRDEAYWAEHHADIALMRAIGTHLGITLLPATLTLRDGVRVGLHGLAPDSGVLVQCAPYRGAIKSTHRNMVLAAALRLVWLRTTYYPNARTILALSEPMSQLIVRGAWLPEALADLNVDALVVGDDGAVRVGVPGVIP